MPTAKMWFPSHGAPCAAFVTTLKGELVDLNRPAAAILGYDCTSVSGRRCHEIFEGRDAFGNRFCLPMCPVREMVAGCETVRPFEARLKSASGNLVAVSMFVVALRHPGRRRPAILHLFAPLRPAARAAGRLDDDALMDGPWLSPGNGGPDSVAGASRGLTRRESEILALMAAGRCVREIARSMGISPITVRSHLKRMFPKLKVHSQAEAVSYAFRNNLI